MTTFQTRHHSQVAPIQAALRNHYNFKPATDIHAGDTIYLASRNKRYEVRLFVLGLTLGKTYAYSQDNEEKQQSTHRLILVDSERVVHDNIMPNSEKISLVTHTGASSDWQAWALVWAKAGRLVALLDAKISALSKRIETLDYLEAKANDVNYALAQWHWQDASLQDWQDSLPVHERLIEKYRAKRAYYDAMASMAWDFAGLKRREL